MGLVLNEDFIGGAAATALASGIGAGNTSLTVTAGGLTTWTPVVYGRIPVVIDHGEANEEHLYATAVSGDMLTGLIRGADGTVAQAHNPSAKVINGLFASHVAQPNAFLSLPTAADQVAVSSAADTWTAGTAKQVSTHASPDTDAATSSLHHTIGTGANQAAPGTHPPLTAAHGTTGSVVGTTDTQTLTNKTLTAPVINDGTASLGGGTLILPQGTAPAETAEGSVVWDTDDNLLTVGDGAGRKTMADTTTAQTLTSKTLTAPVIADFTNAAHDHGDADDGGALAAAALPAGTPRGLLAHNGVSGDSDTFTGTLTDLNYSAAALSATFTAVAGRSYRLRFIGQLNSTVTDDVVDVFLTDAANAVLQTRRFRVPAAGGPGQTALAVERVISGQDLGAGSVTVKVRVHRAAGSGTCTVVGSLTTVTEITVEDVGVG